MKKIYEIWTYVLIGKTLFTYKERPDLTIVDEERNIFKDSDGMLQTGSHHYFKICIGLDKFPKGSLFKDEEKYLPYFADVTEDLPSWATWEPKTWKGCQLLTEKPGGYLLFEHKDSGEILKIAMNSNTYEPCDFCEMSR
ncbi:MAG: hypothetical protein AABY15_06930 [Nanoarchaeota archaeon]